jgi:hypothetical protein
MCDTCQGEQSCVNEKCCVLVTCDAYPSACGGAEKDNGCGEPIYCGGPVCGDGKWMMCVTGACWCPGATGYDNAGAAQVECSNAFPGQGTTAAYCGAVNQEQIPLGCKPSGKLNQGVDGWPMIWCCK